MSRNQLLIKELLRQISDHDLSSGEKKQVTIRLSCGTKIIVRIKIEQKDRSKFKVVKDE